MSVQRAAIVLVLAILVAGCARPPDVVLNLRVESSNGASGRAAVGRATRCSLVVTRQAHAQRA